MTWLVTLISLGESNRNDINRATAIFNIFDFNNRGIISKSEFVSLFSDNYSDYILNLFLCVLCFIDDSCTMCHVIIWFYLESC